MNHAVQTAMPATLLCPAGQRGGAAAGGVWLWHRLHRAARGRARQVRSSVCWGPNPYCDKWAGSSAHRRIVQPMGTLGRCAGAGYVAPLRCSAWLCFSPAAAPHACRSRLQATSPVGQRKVAALRSRQSRPHCACCHALSTSRPNATHPAGLTARCSARSWAPRQPCPAAMAAAAAAACLRACSARCWTSSTGAWSTPGAWWWSEEEAGCCSWRGSQPPSG